MLILYSVFFWNDSIGIFMRYSCLKIMSVFHITLRLTFFYGIFQNTSRMGLKFIDYFLCDISTAERNKVEF